MLTMFGLRRLSCFDCIMKALPILLSFLILYGNVGCRETEDEGYRHDDSSNLTSEDRDRKSFENLMITQRFTPGTLLGLLVASMVVVIGSFLVLWRLCCDVEMVVSKEVMEPLNSISQKVSGTSKRKEPANKTMSKKKLLNHGCSSSVLEIV